MSLPFLMLMRQPCSLSLFVSGVLACMPGKSLALYTVKTSLMAVPRMGALLPSCMLRGEMTTSENLSRKLPGVRQLRSGKQKKQPSSPFSSRPTNGEATRVPMSRRCCR